jgi:hypothetical protein
MGSWLGRPVLDSSCGDDVLMVDVAGLSLKRYWNRRWRRLDEETQDQEPEMITQSVRDGLLKKREVSC